jgi:hypothetical protein
MFRSFLIGSHIGYSGKSRYSSYGVLVTKEVAGSTPTRIARNKRSQETQIGTVSQRHCVTDQTSMERVERCGAVSCEANPVHRYVVTSLIQ